MPSTSLLTIEEFENAEEPVPSVGGSYYICIDPSRFGPLAAVKARSDAYINAIKNTKPRPGHSVRVPGESGYQQIQSGEHREQVLENHWQPFFENIAGRYGISEQQLRQDFAALE